MKSIFTVAVFVFLVFSHPAAAQESQDKTIAIVDLQLVIQSVGYETLSLLTADAETLKTIKDLNVQKRQTQKQLIDAKDRATLEKAQETLSFIDQKIRSIRGSIQRSDATAPLTFVQKYISEKYRGKYLLITTRQEGSSAGAHGLFIPRDDVRVVNITDQVLKDLQAELK
jgi:Skp family chaperone for outer membrane proteins